MPYNAVFVKTVQPLETLYSFHEFAVIKHSTACSIYDITLIHVKFLYQYIGETTHIAAAIATHYNTFAKHILPGRILQ